MDSSPARPSLLERLSAFLSHEPEDREELLAQLRSACDRSLIDPDALSIIEGALQMSDMKVREVMVPRAQMDVLHLDDPIEKIADFVVETAHSRFPAVNESKDDIVGIFLAKDLLHYYSGREFNLREMLRPAVFVPESKRLNVLLREFRVSHNHMAIVVDEYGGVARLVTIEDVLEQVVGDIEDEFDIEEDEGDIFGLADRTYRVSGDTSIERVEDAFGVKFTDGNEALDFDTIGGLIAHEMGHVPRRGEHHTRSGLQFMVLHTKGGAVKWFKVSPEKS